jgi:hypothetical protein
VKKSIVTVKVARVNGGPKYKLYGNGHLLDEAVERILRSSGIGLSNAGGLQEIQQFWYDLSDFKIIVCDVLLPDRLILAELPFQIRNYTDYMTWKWVTTM